MVTVRNEVPTCGFFGKSVISNAGLLGTQVRGCPAKVDTGKAVFLTQTQVKGWSRHVEGPVMKEYK